MEARAVVDRLWPSVVALLGTVAVIVGLLVVFGGEAEDSGLGLDDILVEGTPSPTSTSAPPSPSPTETTPPADVRAPVLILNQTGVAGLAAATAEVLDAQGWELAGLGNTSVAPPETTVFYPPRLLAAAETLDRAFDGIDRVRPTVAGQSGDVLTLVLAGTDVPPTPAG